MTSPAEVIAEVRARVVDGPYDDLRERLDALAPQVRRRRTWRETSVLLDLAHGERATAVRRQLAGMRQRHEHRGTIAEFEAFWQICQEVLGDRTIGAHGYQTSLAAAAGTGWSEVSEVITLLEQRGLHVFADSGTLLGLVREGGFIDYDDDVDLALVVPGEDVEQVAAAWWALRGELLAEGHLDVAFEQRAHLHAKITTPSGLGVDLFPAWVIEGMLWVWPHTPGAMSLDQLLPMARREVGGVEIPLPRDAESMLELNYGPGWRTPDPTWSFNWPDASTPTPFRPWIDAMRPDGPPDRSGL